MDDINALKKNILQYELTLEKHEKISKILGTVIGLLLGFVIWVLLVSLVMSITGHSNGWIILFSLIIALIVAVALTRKMMLKVFEKKREPLFITYSEAKKKMAEIVNKYSDYLLHETPKLTCHLNQISEGIGENWWGNRELTLSCDESDLVYTLKINSIEEFAQYLTEFVEYGFEINEEIIERIWYETFEKGRPFVLYRVIQKDENFFKEQSDGNEENRAVSNDSLKKRYLSLLGLNEECTKADIKKAYREKSKEFHPDTIQGKGLNEIFIHFAEDQFKLLTEAYEWLNENVD